MTIPLMPNRVAQEWTGTGNGASIALGAALAGYRTLAAALPTIGETFRYAIAHPTASPVEWEEGIGTTESGAMGRTTVLDSSAGAGVRVTFTAGTKHVFISPGADVFDNLPGRIAVTLTTSSIPIGTAWTGTMTVGSLAALHLIETTDDIWVRVYGTAADRTADTRTHYLTLQPDGVLYEAVLYGATQDESLVPPLFLANGDDPALRVLYVSVVRLDSGGGLTPPAVALLTDTLVEGAQDDLNDHVISGPGATGANSYEYLGGDDTDWQVRPSGDPSGATRASAAGVDALVARVDNPVADDLFAVETPMYRGSVESSVCAHGLAVLVPDTALGSWGGFDYIRVMMEGNAGGLTGDLTIDYMDGPLTSDTVAIGSPVGPLDFELSAEHILRVEIEADEIRVYWDGVLQMTETIPANLLGGGTPITDLQDGAHRHLGFYGHNDNNSGRVTHRSLTVEDISPTAGGAVQTCDLSLTRVAA